jgi:hypothetical protein
MEYQVKSSEKGSDLLKIISEDYDIPEKNLNIFILNGWDLGKYLNDY